MTLGRRLRLFLLAALAAVVLSACEIAVDVDVAVDEDGSGNVEVVVTLDEEAVLRGPEDLDTILRTSDLVDNGWEVEDPAPDDDDGLRFVARKAFNNEQQLQTVLSEIAGDDMFRDFRLERTSEFALKEYRLDGEIDLRSGVSLFNDPEVTTLLNGNPFGKPVEDYLAGQTLDDAVPVRVRVSLPGNSEEGFRSEATFQPRFDDDEPTPVVLSTVDENFVAILLRWIGFATLALFALAAVLGLLGFFLDFRARRNAPRIRTPEPMASRVPSAPGIGAVRPMQQPQHAPRQQRAVAPVPQQQGPAGAAPSAGGGRQLRMVVFEPLGVLYDLRTSPRSTFVGYARDKGSDLSGDELSELYSRVIRGALSTEMLWDECGLGGEDPVALDRGYIDNFRPRAGAAEFLREMRRRQMPLAVLTDDAVEWSTMRRERDNLGSIEPWMISGSVGAAKPDPGLYEALRRSLGQPYQGCLFIDVVEDHLDAAKTLGMQTAYMTSNAVRSEQRPNHPIVTNFSDFFRRR